jgi:hypothetical protein
MLVEVTQEEDIRAGCQGEGTNCPVARAVVRATGIPYAWVCSRFIAVYATWEDATNSPLEDYKERSLKYWTTPDEASWRIRLYDETGYMSPFSFQL